MRTECQPRLIAGGAHVDHRGTISFFNDFDPQGAGRFYIIRNRQARVPRGWVGHRREQKWFTAIQGEVLIAVVKPDDWDRPASDLPVARYLLSAGVPQILHVPPGHATASLDLTPDALLLVFSSGKIEDATTDDYRFPCDQWGIAE